MLRLHMCIVPALTAQRMNYRGNILEEGDNLIKNRNVSVVFTRRHSFQVWSTKVGRIPNRSNEHNTTTPVATNLVSVSPIVDYPPRTCGRFDVFHLFCWRMNSYCENEAQYAHATAAPIILLPSKTLEVVKNRLKSKDWSTNPNSSLRPIGQYAKKVAEMYKCLRLSARWFLGLGCTWFRPWLGKNWTAAPQRSLGEIGHPIGRIGHPIRKI